MVPRNVVGTTLIVLWAGWVSAATAADSQHDQPRLRRPVGLAIGESGGRLLVANRCGSVSIVDLAARRVTAEVTIGKQLAVIQRVGERYLLLDEQGHELVFGKLDGDRLEVTQRLAVAPYPVGLAVTPDGRQAVVTSLWSRRLTFVDLPAGQPAKVRGTLDLPFAPRVPLFVRNGRRLIVGDAFSNRLAVLDPAQPKLELVRTFPSHNIRGLAVSHDGKMLIFAHQMLNELAHTVRNDVHWGLLMSNDLRWLQLDQFLAPDPDVNLYKGAHMHPLGEAGNAAADPSGLAVGPDGTVVVALGGVGEIAIGKERDFRLSRVRVGKRPTAVQLDVEAGKIYVANTFSDSISIVDRKALEMTAEISLGPQSKLSLIDRGELLFHDGRLSHDGWMSCQSCHTDGHANGMLNDNFSDASFGAPKRVLSLLGRADTQPFAWNGSAADLKTQIAKSISVTMQGDQPPTKRQLEALAAYVESLPAPPSIDQARGTVDQRAIERGKRIFTEQGCVRCHAPPSYTTPKTYDVGLHDKLGNRKFNPPTLRGVGQRGPYFHDGRAATLSEVIDKFRHRLAEPLSDDDAADLRAFLRSL